MTRAKDISFNQSQRENIEQKFKETLFDIECKIKDLDQYKMQYNGLVNRVKDTNDQISQYMEQSIARVGNYFRKTDEQLMKTQ